MADFSKAKTVTAERVRFEVAGGDHIMIVAFHFRRGIAFIKFIGTHAEYDRIDAATEIGRAPSELQALMRRSYAVFCLKKKTNTRTNSNQHGTHTISYNELVTH